MGQEGEGMNGHKALVNANGNGHASGNGSGGTHPGSFRTLYADGKGAVNTMGNGHNGSSEPVKFAVSRMLVESARELENLSRKRENKETVEAKEKKLCEMEFLASKKYGSDEEFINSLLYLNRPLKQDEVEKWIRLSMEMSAREKSFNNHNSILAEGISTNGNSSQK